MDDKFKKKLTLLDLTFLGLGSIIGSGWLFASMNGAQYAGSIAWLAWVGGAIAVLLIGLVYGELAAALPRAGGFVRYPEYTHGSLVGYMTGFASLMAYSSVAGIEVEAVVSHASYYAPWLMGEKGPSLAGTIVEILLLAVFFLLNYWSVNVFGKVNTIVTAFKFIVPTCTVIALLVYFKGSNLAVTGAAPGGAEGVFTAIAGGGIVFAFLGFRQAVDFGAEAKNPQRDIPRAIIIAVFLGTAVYILLQLAFLGAVPSSALGQGWGHIKDAMPKTVNYPFVWVASSLGLTWLSTLLLIDAVISPAGTGNIYLSGTGRVLYAWSNNRHFYSFFSKVDPKTGVPRAALWLSFILAIVWILPAQFDTWSKLVDAVTSATVMTYMVGPISMMSMRRTLPNMKRPFRLPGGHILAPLAFIAATCIIYWAGWNTDEFLIGLTLASLILYFAFMDKSDETRSRIGRDWKAGVWLVVYYIFILIMSYIGAYGPMKQPWVPGPYLDTIVVVIGAILLYFWGLNSALPEPSFETDTAGEAPPEFVQA
ncbi:APC family permease [Alicyclobacillus macrosporangiidus]|uniref:APC family permease n=1 Tax=Alicyclobacillus macrosporangiidus TaxID=392015 RepID=UPI000498142F|nr:APC family permease [Alicyclobacillus macrosporangiidus]